jgi:lipooligosaccharide transport system permease protein
MSTAILRITPPVLLRRRPAAHVVERNALLYRRSWPVLVSGFFEPLFYLLSIGLGIGKLVGHLHGIAPATSYTQFVAPAMLSASAMNGAVIDSTFNVFFKLKYAKLYDAMMATPIAPPDIAVGEVVWALLRGLFYATAFLIVMAALGLIRSPWALLALPASVVVGFGFAAIGVAVTTWIRSWQDFEFITLALLPMFLFSATFYPLASYSPVIRELVRLTPLYQAVALQRALVLGDVAPATAGHAGYLLVMGLLGTLVAWRRLDGLLRR